MRDPGQPSALGPPAAGDAAASPWLPFGPPRPGAAMRMFCFPFAGGGANYYRPWTRTPPPGLDIVPVQLPGREQRIGEPPFTAMAPLVGTVLEQLLPLMDRPFALFGHSMGAAIAYALAAALPSPAAAGLRLLAVSGLRAPGQPRRMPRLHDRDDAGFLAGVRDLGGTPEGVFDVPELVELLMPTLRADFALVESWAHAPPDRPLAMPVAAFGGADDPETPGETLHGWASVTSARCTAEVFPGGHFFLTDRRTAVLDRVIAALEPDRPNAARGTA